MATRSTTRRSPRRWVVVPAIALAAAVAFPASSSAANFAVRAKDDNTWGPVQRHISKGDRITWKNPTSRRHEVKSIGNKWSKHTVIRPGEITRKRFKKTGRFRFRCTIHSVLTQQDGRRVCSGMCGEIHVMSG